MIEEQREIEVGKGRMAAELMRQVEPYFDEVHQNLVSALVAHSSTDLDGLQAIKMQISALEALRLNIESVIATGTMAEMAQEH